MYPSVSEAWPVVAREHEGVLPWMYLDTVGLVTAGIGTLLDTGTGTPPEACLALPWKHGGVVTATRAEIAAGWSRVKARADLAPLGGDAFIEVTTLRLDARTVDKLLLAETGKSWAVLAGQLPALEAWPADAQLALIDMAYQLGPRFMGPKWPNFTAAAKAGDFAACALHCAVTQANAERNAHRARLFTNAAKVAALGIDPAILWDTKQPEENTMAAKVAFRGGLTCSCVATSLPWVEADMISRGIIRYEIDIYQLGWRDNVVASAGTHAEGGCTDVGQWSVAAIDVWRRWGWTMQRRDLTGIQTHGHGWPYGCPHLAPAAEAQARAWDNGKNGLANGGPIAGRYPVKHWDDALEAGIMSIIDDIAAAVDKKLTAQRDDIAKEVRKQLLATEDLNSPAEWQDNHPTDKKWPGLQFWQYTHDAAYRTEGRVNALNARFGGLEAKLDALLAQQPNPPAALRTATTEGVDEDEPYSFTHPDETPAE